MSWQGDVNSIAASVAAIGALAAWRHSGNAAKQTKTTRRGAPRNMRDDVRSTKEAAERIEATIGAHLSDGHGPRIPWLVPTFTGGAAREAPPVYPPGSRRGDRLPGGIPARYQPTE